MEDAPPSKRRRKGKVAKPSFKLASFVKEDHNKPIFGVQFNPYGAFLKDPQTVFAAVGANRASIYECEEKGTLKLLQAYVDDPCESYYTCAWSYDPHTYQTLLAVAGSQGIIRILRPSQFDNVKTYTGHGQAINELKFHPMNPSLLLSVSKDHAMRLWNTKTETCVLVLGGEKGHRDEVLSADFNLDGSKIVSGGMDHSLKIWDLECEAVKTVIANSFKVSEEDNKEKRSFRTHSVHFPIFSTSAIHWNYVDCVRWFGDMIISKSTESSIVYWIPEGSSRLDTDETKSTYLGDAATALHRLEYSGCEIWYVRFSFDPQYQYLAVGNQDGKLFVWNVSSPNVTEYSRSVLEHKRCTSTIRQTAFSEDGSILIACCDDGTLWRWDMTNRS